MKEQSLSKQDAYFEANIQNIIRFAQNRSSPEFSSFLDERQRMEAQTVLNREKAQNYMFFGGTDNCDRTVLGVFPDSIECKNDYFPIVALEITCKGHESMSHRDCLGSLMGLNIKREVIGDIIVKDNTFIVFVLADIADFIIMNLDKIGRRNVTVAYYDGEPVEKKQEYAEITGTVSSMRLDCVVALLINKSRSIAVQTINAQLVKVNYQDVQNVSKTVNGGDVITIRGKGKFIVADDFKKTKKDRYFITVKKLL